MNTIDSTAAFEIGLLPAIAIEGEPPVSYSLLDRMAYYGVLGVSVAVIKDNAIECVKAYGIKDKESAEPVTVETRFQAASMSKPLTGLLAVKLADKGIIDLEKPLNDQLKSWRLPENELTEKQPVTPQLLLLHKGGINVSGFPGYSAEAAIPALPEILEGQPPANTEAVKVELLPGDTWSYSGGGYEILQLLIEDSCEKTYEEAMDENIFEPLALRHSGFSQNLSLAEQSVVAKGHLKNGQRVHGGYHRYPEKAAAGLWTNPADYTTIVLEILKANRAESRLDISREAAKTLVSKNLKTMAYGFIIRGEGEKSGITFGGANEGYRCMMYCMVQEGCGAVIMTNSENGDGLQDEVFRSLSREYGWPEFRQETLKALEVPASILRSYEGSYKGRHGEQDLVIEIKLYGSQLIAVIENKDYKFYAKAEGQFINPDRAWTIDFKDVDGRVDNIAYCIEYEEGLAARIE